MEYHGISMDMHGQEGPTRTYVGVTENSKLPGPRHPDAGTNPRVSSLGLAGKLLKVENHAVLAWALVVWA